MKPEVPDTVPDHLLDPVEWLKRMSGSFRAPKSLFMGFEAGQPIKEWGEGMPSVMRKLDESDSAMWASYDRGEIMAPAGVGYWLSKSGGKPTDGVDTSTMRGTDSMDTHQSEEPSVIPCPEGVHILTDADTGGIVKIAMAHNHFVITRSQLRWKKVKAVLLWAFIAVGFTLGWNYAAPAVVNFVEERQAVQKHAAKHYRVGWVCGNCKHSSLPRGQGTMALDVVKGAPVDLSGVACPKCMVIGSLSPR